ncbi:MAG: TIR domain-containing protein, partial [Leptolyngbya sp. SIO3F4]|nr:TIR domain-containing protein [Leptolyngbya sp. SIO3F4]
MNSLLDVFISYGRLDSKSFTAQLSERLVAEGLNVWVDFDNIPLGVDYQEHINQGIDTADNFLFIISPHSINSQYCQLELDLAIKRNKRIIPILHVEEIDFNIWKERNPDSTADDWSEYKAQGKQCSLTNMHPLIEKINWVHFRENKDDFDQSFQGLLNIFQQQKDYIRLHTKLLIKALTWEEHQKQSRYLLTGEELQQAETWLTTRLYSERFSCTPTDLQCELIAESTKNANNLMTQVFLAYAENDKELADKIRLRCFHMGITVWTSKYDINTGEDFEVAINRGIEAADNLIFLISPEALQSPYCQHELEYALSLNKRIIPLLTKLVDRAKIPPSLQTLQYIDLADNLREEDYYQDENKLLRILQQDDEYYRDHKTLLVKAFKWERQQRNPGILLRGYDLHAAEAWLKTAQRRENHRPLQIQIDFIEESAKQPPDASLDVFISYSRSDSEFARRLNNALQKQGKKTWFDQESIAAGTEDFEAEIYRGIELSDNFVFVLSPRAVTSPYCDREVDYAARLNKRFITVLYQPIETEGVNAELAKVQWIDFSQSKNFYNGFNQMIRILEADRDHVQRHTQISLQALQWQQKQESSDLLFRGGELAAAQTWYNEAENGQKQPQPTELQIKYLQACNSAHQASIQKDKKQQRLIKSMLILMTTAFIGALGLSGYAFNQRQEAEKERKRAENLLKDQISLLSEQARSLSNNGQNLDALVQATHASHLLDHVNVSTRENIEQVGDILQESLSWIKARNRVKAHNDEITAMEISPNGKYIATASNDQTVKIWDSYGRLIHEDLEHQSEVQRVKFTPNGEHLITQSRNNVITIWRFQNNNWITSHKISYETDIWAMDISRDSRSVAIGDKNGQLQIWDIATGQSTQTLIHGNSIGGVRFS